MKQKNKYSGTKTEKNLEAAFAGESQARNKYTFFASVAKKQGFEQIAALFLKTADNEKEHAKMWFKELSAIGDTAENLLSAAEGENYEWTDMYDGFAKPRRRTALRSLRKNSAWLRQSRKRMRSATARCFQTLRMQRCLKKARLRFGNAAIAGILLSA